ncbi:DNA ligase [Gossypium arboreum]|uniref:DNA ligase n=1 Tax=Gossypium arboreum TaxID=29729 RepID=A0A0B0NHI6_GOSAR|nr:DNA ligase [Gossypium arboreum]
MDAVERRDHIFFKCNFFRNVCKSVLRLCSNYRAVETWRQELAWAILKLKGKSLLVAILKLAWSAYLYVIWRQRNKRYFGVSFLTEDVVLVQIKEIVQARLGERSINRTSPVNASLCAS